VMPAADRIIATSKRLSAERQIHAAIAHYRAGDFECAITLSSAAEGQIAEPADRESLFRGLVRVAKASPLPNGEKDDFNYAANWMKHGVGPDECDIHDLEVAHWLYRVISKFWAFYGVGTAQMADLFAWAGKPSSGE